MDWKISLDRYLTNPPDNGFYDWYEEAIEAFSESFFNDNEDWVMEGNGTCNKWLNTSFDNGKGIEETVKIVERAFKIYYENKLK